MKLSELKVGDSAEVRRFAPGSQGYRARLMAMGLIPGTAFRVQRLAPLGDPMEIEVRGFSLSLRRAEADVIEVERKT
jgi:ferrous iron transport protein A